jgi:hypothetical protein
VTVNHIQDNLRVMKSRYESYANKRHRPLEFEVGDHVYLKVSPMKGMNVTPTFCKDKILPT